MNRYVLTFLLLLPLSALANAKEYAEFLRKADDMRDGLEPMELVTLALATTREMEEAQEYCRKQMDIHSGLGVVFELNGEGKVTRTWTRHGSEYEECFATTMKERIHYVPPQEPFYTAIDFGRE